MQVKNINTESCLMEYPGLRLQGSNHPSFVDFPATLRTYVFVCISIELMPESSRNGGSEK
jgi:hypothetical protein